MESNKNVKCYVCCYLKEERPVTLTTGIRLYQNVGNFVFHVKADGTFFKQ